MPHINILVLLQTTPPIVPQTGGDSDGGIGLLFIALVGLVFFAMAAAVIGALNAVLQATGRKDSAQSLVFIVGISVPVVLIWLFWDPLRHILALLAEWSWITLLLLFGAVFVLAILGVAMSALTQALSPKNVAGTLSLAAIAGATVCLFNFAGWGFWPALGVSFASVLALNIVGVVIWTSIAGSPDADANG